MPEGARLIVAMDDAILVVDGGRARDARNLVGNPAGRLFVAVEAGALIRSLDEGASWRQLQRGLRQRYLWSLALDRRQRRIVVVSAAAGALAAHGSDTAESYLYARGDDADREAVDAGLPPPRGTTISSLAADPGRPGDFYAANNHGLYRSEGGASWDAIVPSWHARFHRRRVQGLVALPDHATPRPG